MRWIAALCLAGLLTACGTGHVNASQSPHSVGSTAVSGGEDTSSPDQRADVSFRGITFQMPTADWRVVPPGCGTPANLTVTRGTLRGRVPCPYETPHPTTAVQLSALYGPRFSLTWDGSPTTWQGEPAWLDTRPVDHEPAATLTLPWADARVTAEAATTATARALLDNVHVHPTNWAATAHARSVFVQPITRPADSDVHTEVTLHDPREVRALAADLDDLKPVTDPQRACRGSGWPHAALVTIRRSDRSRVTFLARFDQCRLVTVGTGTAAVASPRLRADLRRLVPNSGL